MKSLKTKLATAKAKIQSKRRKAQQTLRVK